MISATSAMIRVLARGDADFGKWSRGPPTYTGDIRWLPDRCFRLTRRLVPC